MDFVSAVKKAVWIRRRIWADWICVKDGELSKYLQKVTREDLLADDWTAYEYEEQPVDDSSIRFMLLELE